MRKLILAAVVLAGFASPVAAVQVATITGAGGNNTRFVKGSALNGRLVSGTGSTAAWTPVNFRFDDARLGQLLGTFSAETNFTLNTTQSAVNTGGLISQGFDSGTISFRTIAPITVGQTNFAAGANLMSFVIGSGSQLVGLGRSASVLLSRDSGTVFSQITSDFLDFSATTSTDISLSLTGLGVNLGFTSGHVLNGFQGVVGGTVDANPAPFGLAAIPEPATWMTMVLGFLAAGSVVRARRRPVVAA